MPDDPANLSPHITRFSGYFHAPESGLYTFHLKSAGSSQLRLHHALVTDNDYNQTDQWLKACIRLEAGYPLYGHEITQEISPLTAGLGWTVKLEKGADFIGRDALLAEKQNGAPHKVVFFKTGDRRIVRAEAPVFGPDGATVGRVLSGTLSPILNEAIGSALVTTAAAALSLTVDIRGTKLNLHLVKPPFVALKKTL